MTEIQMEYWRTGAVEDVDAFFDGAADSYLFIPYDLARTLGVLWIRWMTIHRNQLVRAFEDDLDLPGRYIALEILVEEPSVREVHGYCMHRTLMQSMPVEWQQEVVALARYAFSRPGADQYHPYRIVPQRRVHGQWRAVEDPVPGHGFGLTRLTPRLESP